MGLMFDDDDDEYEDIIIASEDSSSVAEPVPAAVPVVQTEPMSVFLDSQPTQPVKEDVASSFDSMFDSNFTQSVKLFSGANVDEKARTADDTLKSEFISDMELAMRQSLDMLTAISYWYTNVFPGTTLPPSDSKDGGRDPRGLWLFYKYGLDVPDNEIPKVLKETSETVYERYPEYIVSLPIDEQEAETEVEQGTTVDEQEATAAFAAEIGSEMGGNGSEVPIEQEIGLVEPEPVPEPVAEPTPAAEPLSVADMLRISQQHAMRPKPIVEPVAESVVQPVVRQVVPPVVQPVAEPEPVAEQVVEPEPIVEPVVEVQSEPLAIQPVVEPVAPVVEPAEPIVQTTTRIPRSASVGASLLSAYAAKNNVNVAAKPVVEAAEPTQPAQPAPAPKPTPVVEPTPIVEPEIFTGYGIWDDFVNSRLNILRTLPGHRDDDSAIDLIRSLIYEAGLPLYDVPFGLTHAMVKLEQMMYKSKKNLLEIIRAALFLYLYGMTDEGRATNTYDWTFEGLDCDDKLLIYVLTHIGFNISSIHGGGQITVFLTQGDKSKDSAIAMSPTGIAFGFDRTPDCGLVRERTKINSGRIQIDDPSEENPTYSLSESSFSYWTSSMCQILLGIKKSVPTDLGPFALQDYDIDTVMRRILVPIEYRQYNRFEALNSLDNTFLFAVFDAVFKRSSEAFPDEYDVGRMLDLNFDAFNFR